MKGIMVHPKDFQPKGHMEHPQENTAHQEGKRGILIQ